MKKAHANYWLGRLKRNDYRLDGETVECGGWSFQLQAEGRRQRVTLTKSGKHEAAAQAAELYRRVKTEGWDVGRRWLHPDRREGKETTVGSLIAHVEGLRVVAERTLGTYAYALRWFARQHLRLPADDSRFDGRGGGNAAWREQLDVVLLAELTPQVVQRIVDRYVAQRSGGPLEGRKASTSVRTFVRCAKALFSKRLLKRIALPLPSPLPFAGIELPDPPPTRYISNFNIRTLLQSGREELRDGKVREDGRRAPPDRPVWAALLLALLAGLRRGEIDRLAWTQVRWDESAIWVATTEAGAVKTADSEGLVRVDASLIQELRAWQADGAPADWVIPGHPTMPANRREYRCEDVFGRLLAWLRGHGVNGEKPLHTLRKEFGSHVAAHSDLLTACVQLRHANIATTAAYYVEPRKVVAPSLDELLGEAAGK